MRSSASPKVACRASRAARRGGDGAGLSLHKRYDLAADTDVAANGPVLGLLSGKLAQAGAWVKANPADAASRLAAL